MCTRITERWGAADYTGKWDDEEFPDWSDDTLLNYWRRAGGLGYAAFLHDDKELSMMLVVGTRR